MPRYAEAYKFENVKGPGDARPTALQIVKDEKREGDLSDKVVVITGVSSGIGISTVEAMAATGATVYGTARDVAKAKAELSSLVGSPKVHILALDLSSLASVKAFADELKKRETKVNILINNAGVMAVPERATTADGFELQIGTNHLAHFYLFQQLLPLLLAGSTPEFNSRVVNVSSASHRRCPPPLDDLNLEKPGAYDPWAAYGSSKSANVHMANQIERLYGARGVHGFSLMPGSIATPLQRHMDQENFKDIMEDPWTIAVFRSREQGAATSVWAAVARELEGRGGLYLENCQIAEPGDPNNVEAGKDQMKYGHAKWAYDQAAEEKLWEKSLVLVGLKADVDA